MPARIEICQAYFDCRGALQARVVHTYEEECLFSFHLYTYFARY